MSEAWKPTPETHRYALYQWGGHFAFPLGVYDTPESALDAMRAQAASDLDAGRACTCGDPRELAMVIIPVPRGRASLCEEPPR